MLLSPADASPLRHWPEADRPRERLLRHGAAALTDAELLAILLRTGGRGKSAVALARELLAGANHSVARLLTSDPGRLMQMAGLGPARATTLAVIVELGRRVLTEKMQSTVLLNNPEMVREYLGLTMRGLEHEVFVAVFLNTQHRLIQAEQMFKGTLTQTAVYPREVLKRALALNAASVIIAHNHPSGQPRPSDADLVMTRAIQHALACVDIRMLDHVIVAGNHQYSFSAHGHL